MVHGAGRRSATFFASTLHSTDRSLPCRHELSIAKDVALRVSTRWSALKRANGAPPSLSNLNQTYPPQDMNAPIQSLLVITDGEINIPASPRTDFPGESHHPYEQITDDQPCVDAINTPPTPTEGYVLTSLPVSLLPDERQRVSTANLPLFPTQDYVPTSSRTPFRILTPPDKLDSRLTSWLKNMHKLSRLVDRLHELVPYASVEYRSQLSRRVVTLRAMFKKLQVHCIEFLRLSEELSGRYLLEVTAEIQRQSSFSAALKKRSDMAKTLRRQVVDLRRSYKSGTVTILKDVRAKGKATFLTCSGKNTEIVDFQALSQPLPVDFDLFNEVDATLNQVHQYFKELDKFWTTEIYHARQAFDMGRVDLQDIQYWKNVHAGLKQTIRCWKVWLRTRDICS